MKNSNSILKDLPADILFDITGCIIFAMGLQSFSAPNQIAPGGVSGLSVLINYLSGLSISALVLAFNIPLLFLAWRFLGRGFTFKTLKTVVILTLMLDLWERLGIPAYEGERMLAALYGGVLSGTGIALVFMRGSTTGGTDIASRLIQLKFPHISVGRIILIVDAFVLAASAIVFKNIESALYGLIVIFTSTRIIDSVLYGLDTGKVMMIVSQKHEDIATEINTRMGRGCTRLSASGTFTGQERPVLLCAVRKSQLYDLKRIVYNIDSSAFFLALEASEIIGNGFKTPEL